MAPQVWQLRRPQERLKELEIISPENSKWFIKSFTKQRASEERAAEIMFINPLLTEALLELLKMRAKKEGSQTAVHL
jgi:hypothetical protein